MKKSFKIGFLFLAMMGVLCTACKKDYPEPPIQVLPVGKVYSIDSILKMETGTVFKEDASVYGIVTADEKSGNLYKAAYIQDRKTGKALDLHLNASSGLRIGDSIRIYLKDVTYSVYNGLPQLSDFEADGHIVILANNKPITPAEATIADVVAGEFLGGLVRLSNVMFTEKNTFAEPTTYGNRTLVDPSDFSKTVIVRTSNDANFAKDSLPQGTGSLVAIASLYGSTWQLLIRSATELQFENYTPGGNTALPYYQDFASSFGTYTTYDVMGPQSWEIDYNTAKMTGYVGGTNNPNEDWLISAPFSLEGVSEANMTMKYIARYFSDVNTDLTIQVSEDYTTGDPNEATWTQMNANLSEGTNWNDFATAVIDLSQFAGKPQVHVAVKYVSNTKAGTIEVQSILIQEGGGGTPPTPPGPGGDVQSMPYTQSFASEFGTYMTFDMLGAQSWAIKYQSATMTGYVSSNYYANEDWLVSSPVAITGVTDAKLSIVYIGRYFNNINEDVTLWASTDYVYGNEPNTATWTKLPIVLTEGTNWNDFLTTEVALTDYVGQTVTFAVKYVSTDSKAGTMEVQSITIEEGTGPTPPTPPTPGGEVQELPYAQSFNSEFGTYMPYDVLGGQSWIIKYQAATMTGYVGSNYYANEDWLISSPVDLTNVNGAVMTLTYIARYFDNVDEDVTLWGSYDYVYGNNPQTASWQKLPCHWTEGSNWDDFLTAEVSLADFLGRVVTIAVKYVSTDNKAGTMEIQSIKMEEGDGPTPPTPPGPGTSTEPFSIAEAIALQDQDSVAWIKGFIVGSVKTGVAVVSSNDDINWNAPFDSDRTVLLADNINENDINNCVVVSLPSGKPLRQQVNLKDHPTNLGASLAVTGKLNAYLGHYGLKDCPGTENDFILTPSRR